MMAYKHAPHTLCCKYKKPNDTTPSHFSFPSPVFHPALAPPTPSPALARPRPLLLYRETILSSLSRPVIVIMPGRRSSLHVVWHVVSVVLPAHSLPTQSPIQTRQNTDGPGVSIFSLVLYDKLVRGKFGSLIKFKLFLYVTEWVTDNN